MNERQVFTTAAPQPIGPYSQAIRFEEMLFCSGQIPIDPGTGKLVEGDISAQTERVLRNIGELLRAAGTSYAEVLKTTIFLCDMADFAAVNAVYANYFGESKPARSTVAVSSLPMGAKVEIEVVAALS
ncbi:MAG: reactive intermediate/imine deaminase [Candidatus Meridianibacter frigidus]|nr:MAG: reactive intermediate/imine deaminase [Candidatus Eremiobacteraeota bacterium]